MTNTIHCTIRVHNLSAEEKNPNLGQKNFIDSPKKVTSQNSKIPSTIQNIKLP